MSKAIRFSKAEMAALDVVPGLVEGLVTPAQHRALTSLLAKMVAANVPEEKQPMPVTAREFTATVQRIMGPRVVVVDSTTTFIRLTAALRSHPFASIADVEELATSVLTWANQPINIHTLVQKGPEWLAMYRARQASGQVKPPKGLWDD